MMDKTDDGKFLIWKTDKKYPSSGTHKRCTNRKCNKLIEEKGFHFNYCRTCRVEQIEIPEELKEFEVKNDKNK